MLETCELRDLGLPAASRVPIRLNAGKIIAEGVFRPRIVSKHLRDEFRESTGLDSEDIPVTTRIFESAPRKSDEVVAEAAENGLPLIIRRDGEIVVNFDLRAAQAFKFADTKRPLYTFIPGFNVHKVPALLRRPASNFLQSLRAPKNTDVIGEYSKLPLTGFETVTFLLHGALTNGSAPRTGPFQWPSGKRAVFVSLHDIDTVGFLRRRERDPLFRIEQKHQIKATWFVPTGILKAKDRVDFLLQSGNEVGWHDHSHDHRLPFQPFAEQRTEILKRSPLAEMEFPLGMRTPKLMKSNHLFELLDTSCPILRYDTSFLRGIVPYPLWVNGRQSRILEIPTTVPTDIRVHNQLRGVSGPRKFQAILEAQIARTKKLIEVGALISIVTHPEKDLSERPELLNVYDQYLSWIRSCPDLWFATAGELYNYWTGGVPQASSAYQPASAN